MAVGMRRLTRDQGSENLAHPIQEPRRPTLLIAPGAGFVRLPRDERRAVLTAGELWRFFRWHDIEGVLDPYLGAFTQDPQWMREE